MHKPDGFNEYWDDLLAEVDSVVSDWERIDRAQIATSRGKQWKVDWIRYSSLDDFVVQGWYSVPYDHAMSGAGFLWLPGYSYGTPPPDDSNLVAGAATLAINIHGNPPDAPYLNPAGKRDYILEGIDNPRTFIYRTIVGHCLCALDVLSEQPEAQSGLVSAGMSQGGGLALLVASLDRRPKICCADMPFLTDVRTAIQISHSGAYRTLAKYAQENPQALETILLFDSLYHADRIKVPTWISAGGKDPTCRPKTVEKVYEALASVDKHYEFFPTSGHVFMPEMNAAYEQMIKQYIVG